MDINKREQVLVGVIVVLILFSGITVILWENINNQKVNKEINSEAGTNLIRNQETKKANFEVNEDIIIIHITGEVKKPGVYKLNENSRIIDAVKAAGGETSEADLSGINLADFLADGSRIIIPDDTITAKYENNGVINMASSDQSRKININRADLTRLTELNGVGDSIAQNIINYREKNNGFDRLEQLKNVSGIGERIFANIKEELEL